MKQAAKKTPSAAAAPTMKLVVDTAAQRVLFAEAGKDAVDLIIGLLAMPLGAADRLLAATEDGGAGALGSVANVYASVERMDGAYMQSADARAALLVRPAAPAPAPAEPPAPSAAAAPAWPGPLFHPVTSFSFGCPMTPPILMAAPPPPPKSSVVNQRRGDPDRALMPLWTYRCDACRASRVPEGGGGFVKAQAMYTVTDDLTVTPAASSVSTVALLKKLGVRDLGAVEKRTVRIGREEAARILAAALQSKAVLTDAFLRNRNKARASG